MSVETICPNCGKRLTLRYSVEDFLREECGCGDCAQAGVRPRSLYRLRLVTPSDD